MRERGPCPVCGGVFRLTGGRVWWHKVPSYPRGPMVRCGGAGQLPTGLTVVEQQAESA